MGVGVGVGVDVYVYVHVCVYNRETERNEAVCGMYS